MKVDRSVLKSDRWNDWKGWETDQKKGLPFPPLQKPAPEDAIPIDLKPPDKLKIGSDISLFDAMNRRKTHRQYKQEPVNLAELSFLLWSVQGLQEWTRHNTLTRRVVPSGGALHPFDIYIFLRQSSDVPAGLYRYLPLSHQIIPIQTEGDLTEKLMEAFLGQYINTCAAALIWVATPARSEWRFASIASKIILLDAGHSCQNLYLACEAIGAGMCAIGKYDQTKMDAVLGLDGENEFAVYAATLGKV